MSLDQQLAEQFKCEKCQNRGAQVKRIATTGTGLSKMFDIQNNTFVMVSCQTCGYTEVYNPDILERRSDVGTILDILFGG